MSCESDCNVEADCICLICEQLLCLSHGKKHHKELNHPVQMADESIKSKINQKKMNKALKIEKNKRINQIISSTCLVISNLQQLAQIQINSVKGAKNLEDLSVATFGFENHLLHLAGTGLINQGIYKISKDQVIEQNSSWNENAKEIEKLNKLIRELEKAKDEKSREFESLSNKLRDIQFIKSLYNEFEEKRKYAEGTK